MYRLDLEKAEEPKIKLSTSGGSYRKQESSGKTSISASLTTLKPLTVDHIKVWKILKEIGILSLVQPLSTVQLFATPWTVAHQASLPSPTPRVYSNSCSLSQWCHPNISSCRPLLLPPSIFPNIRVFSNESALCLRCVCEVAQSCPTLCDPVDCSPPGSSVHGFSRQEYWSGLPFPFPGDLPNPGIEPGSPTLQADTLSSEPPGKPPGSQRIRVSASTSVLPMYIQDWFPFLCPPCSPRDSQESSPTPQFKSINSLALSFLYSPTFKSIHDYWKNHSLD